ncbi:MAG: AAA family ATPase [Lachnospiraceae bacterium]|nr:AAA family ATPase [Lachnospiraceae bacterium]
MRVGICDKNAYYQKRVCEIMNEKYQGEMEIVPLSANEISEIKNDSYDLLLVGDESIEENANVPVVYLSDENTGLVRDTKVLIFRYNNVQMMHEAIYEAKEAFITVKEEQQRIEKEKAEEEARLKAEEEARLKAEEEARLKAEEEARLKAEEEARLKAEEEARLKAEEEARLKAEEEARLKEEEEARIKAEEEARLKAEEEARLKAEEEARIKAEEEARLKEEEAKIKAENEAKELITETKENVDIDLSNLHCKVATFVSLGGGMGSSTMAAGTAVYYAKSGKKVLYVNLKPFSKSGYFNITGVNISISDIIKSVEKNDGNENALFKNICVNKWGVYTMDSFVNYSDIRKFDWDFLKKFLMMVDKIGNYDILILDMNASVGSYFEEILKISSSICIVMDGSPYSNQKACKAIAILESINMRLSDKVKIICNKFANSPEVDRSIENKAIGGVAYIHSDNPQELIDKIGSMRFLNLIIK